MTLPKRMVESKWKNAAMMFVGEYVTGKPYAKPVDASFSIFFCNSKRFAKAKGRVLRKRVLA